MDNIVHQEVKSLQSIITNNAVDLILDKIHSSEVLNKKQGNQSLTQRFVGSLTGSNNKNQTAIVQKLILSQKEIIAMISPLTIAADQSLVQNKKNLQSININTKAIFQLNQQFKEICQGILNFTDKQSSYNQQFSEAIQQQQRYNAKLSQDIHSLQADQYINRVSEAWEAGHIFKGYHPIIQTALFLDTVQQNWHDVLSEDDEFKEYVKNKALNILSHKGIQGTIKLSDISLLETSDSILFENLSICFPEEEENLLSFLVYKAIYKQDPGWITNKDYNTPTELTEIVNTFLANTKVVSLQERIERKLIKQVEKGDNREKTALANAYEIGKIINKDERQAYYWYNQATKENYAPAQYHVGRLYQEGIGGAKNEEKAKQWYTKAAEQGHAKAQASLGVMYYYGGG